MPSPSDLSFMKALAANRKGDKAAARAILEDVLARDPAHADSLEVYGMLLSEAGELDRAIEVTQRVLATRPDSIMAHANISRFWMLKGDKPTAEEWQAKARVLGWKDEIRRKGEGAAPADALEKPPDPELVLRQEAAVAATPGDARARLALAGSYRKLGMVAMAVAQLKAAQAAAPELSVVHLELGKALEEAGSPGEAAEVYRRAIPLAEQRGDFMPRNQMQTRLAALKRKLEAGT
jgi:tetratricopeptide (TPR) repeat protein